MHASVYDFVTRVLGREEVEGKRVLEVGALDVNGSVRPYVTSLKPAEYIGTDRRKGRRVDRVVNAEELISAFGCKTFDVVICLEMLEHAAHWRVCLWSMTRVLKMRGLLVLTTRSPGFPRHDHPNDYWRFTPEELQRPFYSWVDLVVESDPEAPGVFLAAKRNGSCGIQQLDTIRATAAPRS